LVSFQQEIDDAQYNAGLFGAFGHDCCNGDRQLASGGL
jgi:hypothetical protein